jgi:glycosyltransferase involved in cell wall biosynthesis
MAKEIGQVTALLPAYEASTFIQKTLESLSAQSRKDLNVIISVDCCEDNTFEICQAHCRLDSRFTVFMQPERLGFVENCNFLLSQAKTDYVFFAPHDDRLASHYIEELCDVLDKRPEVIMVYSDLLLTYISGNTETSIYTEIEGVADRTERGLSVLRKVGLWWVPFRGIFRLQSARHINGLKTHAAGEYSADFPWLFHMSLLGEFARVPKTLCFKFYMPSGLTRALKHSKSQEYSVYMACMRELLNSRLSALEKIRVTLPIIPKLTKLKIRIFIERACAWRTPNS